MGMLYVGPIDGPLSVVTKKYVDDTVSAAQQGFANLIGTANGIAALGADGKLPATQFGDPNFYGAAKSADLDNVFTIANGAIPASQKGANNGVATLDGSGKLTPAQKPTYTASDVGLSNVQNLAVYLLDSTDPLPTLPAGQTAAILRMS